MTELLREGERIDDLQRDGLKIIQNPDWFCFGMDAVLLSAFAEVREGDECIDLCTGNGVIPILMSGRTDAKHLSGLEIQADIAEMARRSVQYNDISDRVSIEVGDLKDAVDIYGARSADVLTVNPPYLSEDGGLINPADHKAVARHEIYCTLEDVVRVSAKLVRSGGHFYMVHRPFRLATILSLMVEYKLEPKRMRLVQAHTEDEPNMVLIEGVYGGGAGLKVEKNLIIYNTDGTYTDEVKEIYEK